MNSKRGCGLLPWLLAAASLLLFRPGLLAAADTPEHISVTLNAGESYVIDHVGPGATPGVRVIDNPHALVVHNEEPGKVLLLGAEAGKWEITVKLDSGSDATYDVAVNKIAKATDINNPASSPPATGDSGLKTGSAAPVEVKPEPSKLDAGAGPVDTASAAAKSAPETVTIASSSAPAPAAPAEASAAPAPAAPALAAPAAAAPAPAVNPVIPSQAASAAVSQPGRFRTDPSIAASGGDYDSTSVSGGTHYLPADDAISMMVGTSEIFDFPGRIRRVSIADTAIADIQVVNPFQINLIGHKAGFTTLAVWNTQGHYEERQVRIDPNGKQQVMLNCIVAELDRSRIENQGINLSVALANYGVSLTGLPGAVATPYSPTSPTAGGGQSNNGLPLGGTLIPLLLSSQLTYGLSAQNSNVLTQSFFQFLEQHQLAKILAEPHLLANSGEKAKFLSGGEIPIVLAQALNTSIVFKQFGTSVQFVPTVVGRNNIELLVNPEVSAPDFAHGVQLFGFSVPAFVTRRAETLVRLRDNQTLIIAGLILHNRKSTVNKVPYLGDLPYLGSLFRTTGFENDETDLVMSVTPQIVRPLPEGAQIYDPYQAPEMTTEQLRTRALAQPDAARPRF
jgi:Flp pilus assembly secretin CpaC